MAFVDGLSGESRRLRFHNALRSLTPAMLARFTQIDYDREMAIVAIASVDGEDREVAVARYINLADGATCEFAIVVADAWQGRGLGRRMMSRLIDIARERGLQRVEGHVLSTNEPMLELCGRLGFVAEGEADDPGTRRIVLALDAPSGKPGPGCPSG